MQSELVGNAVTLLVRRALSRQSQVEKGKEKTFGDRTHVEVGKRRRHVIRVPALPYLSSPSRDKCIPKRPAERSTSCVLLQAPAMPKTPQTRPRRSSILEKISPVREGWKKRKFDYKQNALRRSEEISRALSSDYLRLFGLSTKTVG